MLSRFGTKITPIKPTGEGWLLIQRSDGSFKEWHISELCVEENEPAKHQKIIDAAFAGEGQKEERIVLFKHGLKRDGRQYPFLVNDKTEGKLRFHKGANAWLLSVNQASWELPIMGGKLKGTAKQGTRLCHSLPEAKNILREFFQAKEVKVGNV